MKRRPGAKKKSPEWTEAKVRGAASVIRLGLSEWSIARESFVTYRTSTPGDQQEFPFSGTYVLW